MTPEPVPGRSAIYRLDVPMFGMSGTNSPYVLDTPEPTIVDTGPADAAEPILDALDTLGIASENVSYIVPTHAHLDHAGGAGHLAAVCENATVVCHPNAVAYLTDEEKLDPDTVCYAHFGWGEPSDGTTELQAYAEMLPAFVESVAAAREEHGDDVTAVANALREEWGHWTLETDVAGVLHSLSS